MKHFVKLLCLGAALAAAPLAYATPISGQITITGNDTFDASTITFIPGTTQVGTSSGTMSMFSLNNSVTTIGSLNYAVQTFATPLQIFTTTQSGVTLSYFLSSIYYSNDSTTVVPGTTISVSNLTIQGLGYFTETGYEQTAGTFNLNSQSGITPTISFSDTSFATPASVTPEPSSLVLLGSGLVSAAGMLIRRRRLV